MTFQMKIAFRHLQCLPSLRTRNSFIDGLPHKDISSTQELGELNRLKLQYTSLRDLISEKPSKRGSPRVREAEWYNISEVTFKDSLLKQAARAYLQPVGIQTTPEIHFFARCWKSLTSTKPLVASVKDYLQCRLVGCVNFFRNQAYSKVSYAFSRFIQRFKPFGFLRVRPNK